MENIRVLKKDLRTKQEAESLKNAKVDPEPWTDIKDTPEDRELYPDDWMKKIFMDRKIYNDLLAKVAPTLKSAVPWMHPNKALWTTLRHLVTGETMTPDTERIIMNCAKSIYSVFHSDYKVRLPRNTLINAND